MLPGALCVSHSNNMARSADGNSIIIYANRNTSENTQAAESRVRDADMAKQPEGVLALLS